MKTINKLQTPTAGLAVVMGVSACGSAEPRTQAFLEKVL